MGYNAKAFAFLAAAVAVGVVVGAPILRRFVPQELADELSGN